RWSKRHRKKTGRTPMSLTNQSAWQRARAIKLHEHFKAIAVRLQGRGVKIGEELKRTAHLLDGRTLHFHGGSHVLRASPQTLRREWDRWNAAGPQRRTANALLLQYRAGCGGRRAVPAKLVAEIHRRATMPTGGRDKHRRAPMSQVYKSLCDDFLARRPLPGIDYADWPEGAEFPWSQATILRKKPARALRLGGNLGFAAQKGASAYVLMDYSALRKCELYTLDDVRLDILCIDPRTGQAVQVVCYVMMEVASRFIVAYLLMPRHAINAMVVSELLVHGLQTPGFGIGVGYKTHILFERGATACSEAEQKVLETLTATLEGVTEEPQSGIKVHRTSMNGGVRWVGAPRDKASGNAAGKGVIESFNRRLHYALLHLPGQRGNHWANTPENLGLKKLGERAAPGSLVAEAEKLARFNAEHGNRLALKLPLLTVPQLHAAVKDAIARHNHEPGHAYTDHGKFTEAEVSPGVWRPLPDDATEVAEAL